MPKRIFSVVRVYKVRHSCLCVDGKFGKGRVRDEGSEDPHDTIVCGFCDGLGEVVDVMSKEELDKFITENR